MYIKSIILKEMDHELTGLQAFLQERYQSFDIEGLTAVPFPDGTVELMIHSEANIPESSTEEIIQDIASFVPPVKDEEPRPLSNEELTDLVSAMYAKLAKEDMIDDAITAKYSEVLRNDSGLSKTTKN